MAKAWKPATKGLIPAHAGKTLEGGSHIAGIGAHPRSRGENIQTCVQVAADLGSSPLTRGKRHRGRKALRHAGLIPAHAGKTSLFDVEGAEDMAHPRSRGENSVSALVSIM